MSDNSVKHETLEGATYLLLAPGATKTNTKIRVDSKNKVVHVESKPTVSPKELNEDVNLEVEAKIQIGEQYDALTTSAKIGNGIIKITVKPDAERILTIEAE